jgi:hypothetical protein
VRKHQKKFYHNVFLEKNLHYQRDGKLKMDDLLASFNRSTMMATHDRNWLKHWLTYKESNRTKSAFGFLPTQKPTLRKTPRAFFSRARL